MSIRRGVRPLAAGERSLSSDDPLVEPSPRHDARPHPWREVRLVGERTVEIAGVHGIGQGIDHVDIDESDDPVVLTVWVGYDRPGVTGLPHRLPGFGYRVRVGLGAPLGDRLVVDGATIDGSARRG